MSLTIEEAISAQFRLEGEQLVRTTGRPVRSKPTARGYQTVRINLGYKRSKLLYVHRVKFFLTNGYLPPLVDHRDIDPENNETPNLRPATKAQNAHNARPRTSRYGRGVQRNPQSGRYWASIRIEGRDTYLGTFDTASAARHAVEAKLRKVYGDHYREHPCTPDP